MGSEGAALRRRLSRPAVCAGLLLTTAITLGCGGDDEGRDHPARPAAQAQVVSALRPDGTVPWVDERAGERDLAAPDPNRQVPARLLVGGRPLEIATAHGVDDAAQAGGGRTEGGFSVTIR